VPGSRISYIEVLHGLDGPFVSIYIGQEKNKLPRIVTIRPIPLEKLDILARHINCQVPSCSGFVRPFTAGFVGWIWTRQRLS